MNMVVAIIAVVLLVVSCENRTLAPTTHTKRIVDGIDVDSVVWVDGPIFLKEGTGIYLNRVVEPNGDTILNITASSRDVL